MTYRARHTPQQVLRLTVLARTLTHVAQRRQTPRMRLASLLMGRNVLDLIEEYRANGATWQEIRQAIRDATNGEIDVTWQAVQSWARREDYRNSA